MWQASSLAAACELLVVACMWDLVPRPGIKPNAGPPVLGVQSFIHCAIREVPIPKFLEKESMLNVFVFSPPIGICSLDNVDYSCLLEESLLL